MQSWHTIGYVADTSWDIVLPICGGAKCDHIEIQGGGDVHIYDTEGERPVALCSQGSIPPVMKGVDGVAPGKLSRRKSMRDAKSFTTASVVEVVAAATFGCTMTCNESIINHHIR